MRSDRFPRATWLVIGAVSVTVTLSVARRTPAVILGGHGTKTDCFAVFDGIDATGGGTPKVRCMDGDQSPWCDRDGDCHNGSCTFHFSVCINQPNVTGCTPPAAGLKKIRTIPRKYRSFTSGLTGSQLTRATCGDPRDVVVKLRGKKKNKPGRQQIRVFAQANGAPPDSDLVNLFCLPRPANQACPGTPTTTLPPCPPGGACTCSGGAPSMLSFTTTAGGSGTCGHLDADGAPNFFTLACGGLYFGGAGVAVPLPSKVPDQGKSIAKVSCNCTTLTMTGASPLEAGGNRCAGGSNHHNSCTADSDCPGGKCKFLQCTNAGCLFGPPLPIPNRSHSGAATSSCVINTITSNATGTGDCSTGSTTGLNVPLSSAIFLDADLMQMRCSGGSTPGANCTGASCGLQQSGTCPGGTCVNDTGRCRAPDSPGTICCSDADCPGSSLCETAACDSGSSNANLGCITDADCPGGTCSTFIQSCAICNPITNTCNAGPNDGLACTPGNSATLGGEFPTSHDCPPPAANNLGALPINFVLDSGTVTKTAIDLTDQSNVFCGFCKSKTLNTFALTCNGSATGPRCTDVVPPCTRVGAPCSGCPASQPCLPVSCTSNADCSTLSSSSPGKNFASCGQRTAGAFTAMDVARTIVEMGSPSGSLATGGPAKPATLVSIFCIPLTFSTLVDSAADLPGPGAVAITGVAQALP